VVVRYSPEQVLVSLRAHGDEVHPLSRIVVPLEADELAMMDSRIVSFHGHPTPASPPFRDLPRRFFSCDESLP